MSGPVVVRPGALAPDLVLGPDDRPARCRDSYLAGVRVSRLARHAPRRRSDADGFLRAQHSPGVRNDRAAFRDFRVPGVPAVLSRLASDRLRRDGHGHPSPVVQLFPGARLWRAVLHADRARHRARSCCIRRGGNGGAVVPVDAVAVRRSAGGGVAGHGHDDDGQRAQGESRALREAGAQWHRRRTRRSDDPTARRRYFDRRMHRDRRQCVGRNGHRQR